LKDPESLEKLLNGLSINKLVLASSDWSAETKDLVLRCSKELANLILDCWQRHLKVAFPTKEFFVEVEPSIECIDDGTEHTYRVSFFEIRPKEERMTFRALVISLLGEPLPSYYMKRLGNLFRRRYFQQAPADQQSKPNTQGKVAVYLATEGKEMMVAAMKFLCQSLQTEIQVQSETEIDLSEDQAVLEKLKLVNNL